MCLKDPFLLLEFSILLCHHGSQFSVTVTYILANQLRKRKRSILVPNFGGFSLQPAAPLILSVWRLSFPAWQGKPVILWLGAKGQRGIDKGTTDSSEGTP